MERKVAKIPAFYFLLEQVIKWILVSSTFCLLFGRASPGNFYTQILFFINIFYLENYLCKVIMVSISVW